MARNATAIKKMDAHLKYLNKEYDDETSEMMKWRNIARIVREARRIRASDSNIQLVCTLPKEKKPKKAKKKVEKAKKSVKPKI